MYRQDNKRIKLIILAIGLFIVSIIVISVIITINRSGKIKTTFKFEPTEAQVFLNYKNKNVNNSTIYLSPGKYQLSAFLDGYIYQTNQITVNEYNPNIVGQLIPINASDNEINDLLGQLNTIQSIAQSETQDKLIEKFPIINYLPYNTVNGPFGITYNINDDYTELNIDINLKQKDNSIALNYAIIKLKNFDPNLSLSEYNINIHNFTNIFTDKFQENNKTDPIDYIKTGFNSIKDIQIQEGITKDDYYYTIIKNAVTVPNTTNIDYIPYVIMLKKNGDSWLLTGTPNPILTIYNTPDVPREILDSANSYVWSTNE